MVWAFRFVCLRQKEKMENEVYDENHLSEDLLEKIDPRPDVLKLFWLKLCFCGNSRYKAEWYEDVNGMIVLAGRVICPCTYCGSRGTMWENTYDGLGNRINTTVSAVKLYPTLPDDGFGDDSELSDT